MATKEILPPQTEKKVNRSFSAPNSNELKKYIDEATEHLLFKDFDKCIEICEAGISQAKLTVE